LEGGALKLKHAMLLAHLAGCISAIGAEAARLDDLSQFDIPAGRSDQTRPWLNLPVKPVSPL